MLEIDNFLFCVKKDWIFNMWYSRWFVVSFFFIRKLSLWIIVLYIRVWYCNICDLNIICDKSIFMFMILNKMCDM